MMRAATVLVTLLAAGCATHSRTPARYDFDSMRTLVAPDTRLHATIAIPPVSTPSWLRTPALIYRLAYATAAGPHAYALSAWTAPPAELVTLRLRQAVAAANSGFTLGSLPPHTPGYRLDMRLEQFVQVFVTPHDSRCLVTLNATLLGSAGRVLAQRTFHSERAAPRSDAAGGAQGLVEATDSCLDEILLWLKSSLTSAAAPARPGP